MVKKVHVTRFDENVEERAIQMREDNPIAPQETQFWFNKQSGKLAYFSDGEERTMNVRVISGDPATPNEKEVWVNGATDQLKYKYQGIVHTVNLGNAQSVDGGTSTQEYLGILDEAELKQISDINDSYPDYLIESFQDIKDTVVIANANVAQSALTVDDGQVTGTYERETRKTKNLNYVEGVAVITSQGFAPKLITDNNDGTHTVIFRGDVTDILMDAGKLIEFEEDTVEGKEEDFPLLDQNGKPAILIISGAPTYDGVNNETTALINDLDTDLSMGLIPADQEGALRFAPLGLAVEATADGIAGTLGSLDIVEMHSHEAERILGEEVYSLLPTFYKGSTNDMVIKASKNKKYWVIITKEEVPHLVDSSNVARMHYSTDGLKTLQIHPTWEAGFASPGMNETGLSADWNSEGYHDYVLNTSNIHVYDDGRTVFGKGVYNYSSIWQWEYFFCNISEPDFSPARIPPAGGYDGMAAYDTTTHFYTPMMAVLEHENVVAITPTNVGGDPYSFFYKIDFDDPNASFFLGRSANYGTDYKSHHYPSFSKFIHFNGEWNLFCHFRHHVNFHNYGRSVRLTDILAGNTNGTFPNTSITIRAPFSDAPEGGSREYTVALWHFTTIVDAHMGWAWNEDDQELICFVDDNDGNIYLGTINFGRTNPGVNHVEDFSVDYAPIKGSIIWNVHDGGNNSNYVTPSLNFDDDASDIQTKLLTIYPFIEGVEVTGDWNTGFQITDLNNTGNPKPLIYTTTSNSLEGATGASFVLAMADNGATGSYALSIDNGVYLNVAQEFSTFNTGRIDSVSVRLKRPAGISVGSSVVVEFRNAVVGVGNTPGTTILGTSEPIDFNTLSEDVAGADAVFTFSDNAILNGSTPYFLCVRFEDHNGLDNFLMVTTGNGTGAGDTFVLVGATWQEQTNDFDRWEINATPVVSVIETFNTDTLGALPNWLYVTNANTEKWEETGSYFRLKHASIEAESTYSTGAYTSAMGATWKMLKDHIRIDGRTLHCGFNIMRTDYDYDAVESEYWKIPDYRQILGNPWYYTTGTRTGLIIGRHEAGVQYGGMLAEVLTVPNVANISQYPDGKVPVRSIELQIYNNWSTNASYFRIDPEWRIRVSLWGTTLGVPDISKRIVDSVHEYRMIDLPSYDDSKWVNFDIPGDQRFLPGETFALVVEPVNFDGNLLAQSLYPTGYDGEETSARIDVTGQAIANSSFYRWNGTIWESKDYKMWYRIQDFYCGVLPVAHKNNDRRVRGWANDQWYRQDSQTNIEWKDEAAKTLQFHYRNSGLTHTNSTPYSGEGVGAKNFYCEIKDENGQFEYPTITPAKWLGQKEGNIDKEIRWATCMGHPETIKIDSETGERVGEIYSPEGSTPVSRFNYNSAFGGMAIDNWDTANLGKLASEGSITQGVKEDPEFYYGWCTHMRGSRVWHSWNVRQLAPGHEDFYMIIECHHDAEDLDNGHNMIVTMTNLMELSIRENRYYFWMQGHDNVTTNYWTAIGSVPTGHHFVKFYRDIDGARVAISLDGENWNDLEFDPAKGSTDNGTKYKNGFAVGDGTDISGALYIGGYWANTSYQYHGKLGIIKYGVGASHPTSRGVEVDWEWKDVANPFNLGDRFIGSKVIDTSSTTFEVNKFGKLAHFYSTDETSKVRTRDQVLKFRAIVAEGTMAAVKLTLERNTDADPFAVQGYLLNFENRVI